MENTNVAASNGQGTNPTLKLLQNKTHLGPVSKKGYAKIDLSKAAGKILFNNNLKVTALGEEEDLSKSTDPSKKPISVAIPLKDNGADQATLLMIAWDKLYGKVGTPAYQKAYQQFANEQLKVYAEIGIHITPNSPKPTLTEQQRRMYNEKMRASSFSYYEYRLSYKQPGVKAVRSLTYRTLKPKDVSSMIEELFKKATELSQSFEIKIKTAN